MDATHFLRYIIRPTLNHIGCGGDKAEALVLGTALAESNLEYLHQINGPAMGLYQCESATHRDIWVNFLAHRKGLADKIVMLQPGWPTGDKRLYNAHYATAICRTHYLRDPEPLPATLEEAAKTWKRFYNTVRGSGTVEHYLAAWNAAHS